MMNTIGSKIVSDFRVELLELNKLRMKSIIKIRIFLTCIALLVSTLIFLYGQSIFAGGVGGIFFVIGFIFLSVVGSLLFYHFGGGKAYEAKFKELISRKIIGSNFEEADFSPEEHLSSQTARESQLFPYFERTQGSELVEGILNEIPYRFSELDLTKTETYRDSDGDTRERTVPIFHGILIEMTPSHPLEVTDRVTFLRKPKPFKFPKIFGRKKRRISLAKATSGSQFSIENEFYRKGNPKDLNLALGEDILKAMLSSDSMESFRKKGLSIGKTNVYISLDTGDFLPVPSFSSPKKASSYKKWDAQLGVLKKIIEDSTYFIQQAAR